MKITEITPFSPSYLKGELRLKRQFSPFSVGASIGIRTVTFGFHPSF
jgi:hypothetical protein